MFAIPTNIQDAVFHGSKIGLGWVGGGVSGVLELQVGMVPELWGGISLDDACIYQSINNIIKKTDQKKSWFGGGLAGWQDFHQKQEKI